MKVFLVFVFLSLLSASLASLTVEEQLGLCYSSFPEREHKLTEDGFNDIARQHYLCIFKVIGLYADGKFDVNGLIQEVKNQLPPEAIVKLQGIINSTTGRDDGERAVLIAIAWNKWNMDALRPGKQ